MDDDLNISGALGTVFDFIRFTNKKIVEGSLRSPDAQDILEEWKKIDGVLGFGVPIRSDVPVAVERLLVERQIARKAKDFRHSDEIREQLVNLGWTVEDTPQGPRAKKL